jgi:hypothetical protein
MPTAFIVVSFLFVRYTLEDRKHPDLSKQHAKC